MAIRSEMRVSKSLPQWVTIFKRIKVVATTDVGIALSLGANGSIP